MIERPRYFRGAVVMNAILSVTAICLSLLLVWQAVPWVIALGMRRKWVDTPDARKVHRRPMVRVGGLAIAMGAIVASILTLAIGTTTHSFGSPEGSTWGAWGVLVGGFGFFAIGFADDLLQLPPLPRLLLQMAFAAIAWFMGVRVDYLPMPYFGAVSTGLLSLPITLIWLAGTANALNWFDGLDGLAAGTGTLGALLLAFVAWHQGNFAAVCLALALAGATIGFLKFNLPPAKLFMGDGGSYLIGFTLAAISAIGTMQTPSFRSAILPFVILGVPLVDMTLVMLNRVRQGKSPLYPDRSHFHHRLLDNGCPPMFTTGFIWACSGWVGSWAIAIVGAPWSWVAIVGSSIPFAAMSYGLIRIVKTSATTQPSSVLVD